MSLCPSSVYAAEWGTIPFEATAITVGGLAAVSIVAFLSQSRKRKHYQQLTELLQKLGTDNVDNDTLLPICEAVGVYLGASKIIISSNDETITDWFKPGASVTNNPELRRIFCTYCQKNGIHFINANTTSEDLLLPQGSQSYAGIQIQTADSLSQSYLHLLFDKRQKWGKEDQSILDLSARLISLNLQNQSATKILNTNNSLADSLLKHLPTMLAIKNRDGQYLNINAELAKTFLLKSDDIVGLRDHDLFDDHSANQLRRLHNTAIIQNQRVTSELFLTRATKKRKVFITAFPLTEEFIPGGGSAMIAVDITARRSAERALMEVSTRFQITQQLITDGLITLDVDGHVEHINPIAQELIGIEPHEAQGQPLRHVLKLVSECGRDPMQDPWSQLDEKQTRLQLESAVLIGRHGREYAVQVTIGPLRDKQGKSWGAVVSLKDATNIRKLESAVDFQKHHDSLTGLENRRVFDSRLEWLIKATKTDLKKHALCYIDLDQFKVVNDSAGHIAGDTMVRELSVLIGNKIRANDSLARLGGDEFGLLLENCSSTTAIAIAQNVIDAISHHTFQYNHHNFRISASVGIVLIDEHVESASELLTQADVACFTAKENGRNQIHVYQSDVIENQSAQRHNEIKRVPDVRAALDNNRFELYVQAIKPIRSNSEPNISRYEILVRMLGETGEVIVPGLFLPAAERYGLMIAIDRWVISHAIAACAKLILEQDHQYEFGINLSGMSLGDAELLPFVIDTLQRHNLPGRHICFEITETAAISNINTARQFIAKLSALGCTFALDDFGTGLSSFGYLKTLPVDFLKIDGSFVRHIATDEVDHAMVSCIQRMSKTMGVKTIAEFVENAEIHHHLEALGVDYAQGHWIGFPVPLSSLSHTKITDTDTEQAIT